MNNKSEERLQRKIFQPTEETNLKINLICEATGISLSELINSLFDAIDNAEAYIALYKEAKETYRQRIKNLLSHVDSSEKE